MTRETRPITDKLAAALAWLMTGNAVEAEKICGVPARTIRAWTKEESWEGLMLQAKQMKQDELDAKFTSIIHKATAEIVDRLQNGDEVVTKGGQVVKRALGGRELANILAIAAEKRSIIRGHTAGTPHKKDVRAHLADTKRELEAAARGDTPAETPPAGKVLN